MTDSNARALPGFDEPAVTFDHPFEMLEACHGRVERSLALLQRLIDHVATHGEDDDARTAAEAVLRYFDLAAPLHHEDEEQHVFPPLLAQPDEALRAAVAQLQADHLRMHTQWGMLRVLLLALARGDQTTPQVEVAALRTEGQRFAALYDAHIELEETRVYPAARALLSPQALREIGRQMEQRRRPAN